MAEVKRYLFIPLLKEEESSSSSDSEAEEASTSTTAVPPISEQDVDTVSGEQFRSPLAPPPTIEASDYTLVIAANQLPKPTTFFIGTNKGSNLLYRITRTGEEYQVEFNADFSWKNCGITGHIQMETFLEGLLELDNSLVDKPFAEWDNDDWQAVIEVIEQEEVTSSKKCSVL